MSFQHVTYQNHSLLHKCICDLSGTDTYLAEACDNNPANIERSCDGICLNVMQSAKQRRHICCWN